VYGSSEALFTGGCSMEGRGIDLSGGAGSVDLSGGAGAPVNLSGAASSGAPAAATSNAAQDPNAPGGYAGQMGAQMVTAAIQNSQVQDALKAKASEAAAQGWEAAKVGGIAAAEELHKYVQEGPAGISILCFLGGCATTIIGVFGSVFNLNSLFSTPFQWVLSCYLAAFGLVTVLLEADVEQLSGRAVIGKLAPLCEHYQFEIFERAKFLTELRGRGFFYVFVGTLSITQCLVCLYFLAGLWNLLMGVLCLMMSFGINPADHLPSSVPGMSYDQIQGPFGQQPNHGNIGYGP